MRLLVMAGLVVLPATGCRQVLGLEPPVPIDSATLDEGVVDDARVDTGVVDAAPPATLQHTTFVSSTADLSTYGFSNVAIGPAAANRHVLVVAHGRNSTTPFGASSLTIDGVAATKVIANNEDGGGASTALFILAVPTGTSANMTLTYTLGSGDRRVGLAVWAAYGLVSATPFHSMTGSTQMANPSQLMLQVPANGLFVAGVAMSAVVAGSTSTWSGLSENYEELIETSLFSGGSMSAIPTQSQHTLMHSSTDTTTSHHMVAASFR